MSMPMWVIFPKFQAGSAAALKRYPKPNALLGLADSGSIIANTGSGVLKRSHRSLNDAGVMSSHTADLKKLLQPYSTEWLASLSPHRFDRVPTQD
jgi:hypothetical protein